MTDIIEITNPDSIVIDPDEMELVEIGYVSGGYTPVPGPEGPEGDSAYAVALSNGFVGTEAEWLASLVGPEGPQGLQGVQGLPGEQGLPGADGAPGVGVPAGGTTGQYLVKTTDTDYDTQWITSGGGEPGPAGDSAYQVAVNNGFVGTESEWLASLEGPQGTPGTAGASAYQVAVTNGFVGTEPEWLASLEGPQGDQGIQGVQGDPGTDGDSAYQIAVTNGFVGTESQWIDSLEGPQGIQGEPGTAGATGPMGPGVLPYSIAGEVTTGVGSFRLYNDSGAAWTITSVRATVGTAPTGASLIVDVNKNGTTIFTTQANRPTIAAGTNTVKQTVIDVPTVADGEYITVDVDQVGSTVAGSDLTVSVVVI